MSRRNHIHTMDAFIHGYSNFVDVPKFAEEPITAPVISMATPIIADEPVNRYTSRTAVPVAPSFAEERSVQAPILFVESEADKTERLNAQIARETASAQMQAQIRDSRIAIAKIEADRLAKIEAEKQANAPIIVVPTPYSPPPIIIGGGGGGGSMGGGEARKPLSGSTTVAKPSFLKKNFIPLLLVTGAIFVFIKKPIK
jgi:hypothetical protein